MTDTVKIYKRQDGKWDWQRIAENGNIVATSGGQGYENKGDCLDMAVKENPGLMVTVGNEN